MKKALTTTLLAILMCVCMVFGFTACGIFNDKCEHTYDNACDTTCNKCEETRTITHAWVDADCDTPKTCKICGKTEGEALGHTPAEDDGDCSTEVKCTVCGEVTTPAGQHTPNDDDGDCTTAIKCKNCDKDAVAGNVAHSATDTDGDRQCDNPGCEQLIIIASEGLVFTQNTDEDGNLLESYSVTGLGECLDTDIVIPATYGDENYPVTAIGDQAFAFCESLESVTIPDSVETIGNFAFDSCTALKSVTIPASVETIGNEAFYGCSKLESVTIPNSVTTIGKQAFAHTGLTSITIPNSVTTIGNEAFYDCTELTSVYYGGTQDEWTSLNVNVYIIGIGGATFYIYSEEKPTTEGNYWRYVDGAPTAWVNPYNPIEVNGLKFTLNEDEESYSVTGLSTSFTGTEVTIPATINGKPVTTIGELAFRYTALTSVIIPASVTSIGNNAFYMCSSLMSITIPNSVTTIGDYAFAYTGLTSVTFGENSHLTTIGDYAFSGTALTSITIPDSVTTIGDYAFSGTALTSITIPDSVTTIGNNAFYMCSSLTSVTIPDSVTTIGDLAFTGTALTSVNFGANSQLKTIGDSAFGSCFALTSVIIPASVTKIGEGAFVSCPLESVIIPASVTEIGEYAFYMCTSLTSVYYGGTEADWGDEDKITIGDNAIPTNAAVYYYSEEKPEGEGNYWHYDAYGAPTTEWDD